MANVLLVFCVLFSIFCCLLAEKCAVNEQWTSCPTHCGEFCPTNEASIKEEGLCATTEECSKVACQCLFNYRRLSNGTCVPTTQCPPVNCTSPNEYFDPCPPFCPTDDCSNATQNGRCGIPFIQLEIVLPCTPRCRCVKDFWRKDGVCVPYDQCFKTQEYNEATTSKKCCNGPNESYTAEKKSCPPDICVSLVSRYDCTKFPPPAPGCACDSGYLRPEEGEDCVPICQCPQMKHSVQCQSDDHEVENNQLRFDAVMWGFLIFCCAFSLCAANEAGSLRCNRPNERVACVHPCPPEKSCRNRDIRFSCIIEGKCKDKCVCKEGYFRNVLGDCIKGEECDMCPGRNEYFSCGPECDNVCSELHMQNRTNCPIVNIVCNRKCYCDDGFARDADKNCVPVEDCPKESSRIKREIPTEPKCGQNEEYQSCKKTCPPETCISLVARFKCNSKEPCRPRCACKPGFLRKKTGEPCVPMRQCPELANSPDFN
ncbi:zonadhesin [Amyelois transitella]|uniref:zonadhesin n=1 Tax=Amyelois transitella TaxID=680683 RepID=UPI0029906C5C|nr:zonadhesin [Amyelois transitella]